MVAADEPTDDPNPDPAGRRQRRSGHGRLIPTHAIASSGLRVEEFVIRPWPERRARRARWIAVPLLVLAPLVATGLTLWGISTQVTDSVVEPVGREADSLLLVDASAVSLDLQRNEMAFRMVFRPSGELVDGTQLTKEVVLFVNDLSGGGLRTYPAGSTMEPTTVLVDLEGSQLRYPFDVYDTRLVVGAAAGEGSDQQPLALDLRVGVELDQFGVSATTQRQQNTATVDLQMGRRGAVIVWVLFFMVLVWCIALGSAGAAWFIVVYAKDPPLWVYPFFAAILFALPTLRAGLPGAPPYGSLVDWAAFYWGIAVLAGALIALLVKWNVEARAHLRQTMGTDQPGRPG